MKLIHLKIFLSFQLEVSNAAWCKQWLARDKCGIFRGLLWNMCFTFSWEFGSTSLWLSYFPSILSCGMKWLIPKPMSWWPQLRHFPCEILLAILTSLITMSPPRPSRVSWHLKKCFKYKRRQAVQHILWNSNMNYVIKHERESNSLYMSIFLSSFLNSKESLGSTFHTFFLLKWIIALLEKQP